MDREELLKEIFELEPDLRAKEKEVRALVFSMLEHKPVILPDLAMKALVKARLLAQFETRQEAVKSPWFDWIWYTAPVGVALLLFMLVTPPIGVENGVIAPTGSFKSAPDSFDAGINTKAKEVAAPVEEGFSIPPTSSNNSKEAVIRTMPAQGGDEDVQMDTMFMESSPVLDTPNGTSLIVSAQKVGKLIIIDSLVLANEGFIEVRSVTSGDLVAVTPMILSGEYFNYSINLEAELVAGDLYQVVVNEGEVPVFEASFDVLD